MGWGWQMAKQPKYDGIRPDVKNANKGTERGRYMVEASLRETGAGRSILLDKDGRIIAGNKTFEAASDIGLPVRVVETDGTELVAVKRTDLDLDDDTGTARKLAYYDNRTSSVGLEWDAEQVMADLAGGLDLSAMFRQDELDELLADLRPKTTGDTPAEVDRAEELRQKWQTAPGQLWQLGEHRLICGDCTDAVTVARVMGGELADCVFTSPPYAVGVDYGETYQDTIDNLRAMLPKLSKLWLDVVVPGGFAVVNFGDVVSASNIVGTNGPCEYPMALEYWPVFRADGWALWSRRIWCKPGAGTGSMQCISSNRAATNWEHLWTWKKDGPPMFTKQTTGDYPSQNGWIDSTHSEGLEFGLSVHGAGMPPLPALYSVFNHSRVGGVVHEPFCGTGTTIIACESLRRKCFASEINPSFAAITIERWAQHTGKTPVLVDI